MPKVWLQIRNMSDRSLQWLEYQAKENVETDAAYNKPPKSGFEAATQSFSQIEQDTCRKWIPAMPTANKHCSKRKCNHRNRNCKQISVLLKPFPLVNRHWCNKIESIHMEGKSSVCYF